MGLRVSYFVNQYPKVSHAFVRREILALERQGVEIQRIAVRGWDAPLADREDVSEQARTMYLLAGGVAPLLLAAVRIALRSPARFLRSLMLAVKMSRHAERPLPVHMVYLLEACRMLVWTRRFGSSHIHAHFGTNSAEVAMLVHELGGPKYSFTVHGPQEFDRPTFIGLAEKVRRAAFVAVVSSFGKSQLCRWVDHAHWSKIQEIHCGLEEAFYAVEPVPLPSIPRLVCVGRLCEQKGQLLLLEAAYKLMQRGTEFELVLAGDGELRVELEQLIDRFGLSHRVRITGWISSEQVREELVSARGMILPSFAEGLPVVIMEALALRRPVLTTWVAGIPELVREGEGGYLFKPGSVQAVVDTVERFLQVPLDELASQVELGRKRVLERHSVEVEAGALAALFAK